MRTLPLLLGLLAVFAVPIHGWAQQTPVPVATSAPAAIATTLPGPAATLAPIASQLGQTLQTLVGVASSQPAPATDKDEDNAGLITNTYATALLNSLMQTFETLKKDSAAFEANTAAIPDMIGWAQNQNADPRRQMLWRDVGNDMLVIVGVPLLASIAVTLFLLPLRNILRRRAPQSMPGQIALLLSLLALRLLPVIVFLGASVAAARSERKPQPAALYHFECDLRFGGRL